MSANSEAKPVSHIKRLFECLICTDSRGRGIENTVNNDSILQSLPADYRHRAQVNTVFIVRPGAKIDDLLWDVENHPKKHSFDFIIIIAGICNLTVRNIAKGIKTLRYNNRAFATNTKTTIGNSLESFRNKIHFATITPASLGKFFNTNNQNKQDPPSGTDSLAVQQANLTEDCCDINRLIVEKNIERGCPTLRWAGQCMKSTKRRDKRTKRLRKPVYKFIDRNLPDGVHPDNELKTTWFSLTAKFIAELVRREITPCDSSPPENSETDLESDREYDFKRRKTVTSHTAGAVSNKSS